VITEYINCGFNLLLAFSYVVYCGDVHRLSKLVNDECEPVRKDEENISFHERRLRSRR